MEKQLIIKTLLENDNCYVREKDFDLDEIEKEVGFPLEIRNAKNCDVGYVVQKIVNKRQA